MTTRAQKPHDHKRDARNLPDTIKGQLRRIQEAAEGTQLSGTDLRKLEDDLYDMARIINECLAAVRQGKEIADATETKAAKRAAKVAAQAA